MIYLILSMTLLIGLSSCDKKKKTEELTSIPSSQTPQSPSDPLVPTYYIYLASGASYAGLGITLSTPSQIIAKYDTNGKLINVLRDFTASPGDTPVALVDYNNNYLLALIENTAGRRVEMIAKDGSNYSSFLINSNLNGVVKDFIFDYSGGLLISKSTAIEKITTSGTRIPIGANPYISNPGGACTGSATNITKIAKGPDDTVIMAYAFTSASVNNRINLISKTGYTAAADCLASIAAPTTAHFPSSLLYHSSGKLLVSYGNNTGPIHQIYSYDITSSSITNPILAYNDISVLQGISEMIELPDQSILITSASSSFNTVERFVLDSTTGLLTHVGTIPFITPSIFTRSISSLMVAE